MTVMTMPLDEASMMPGWVLQCSACKGNLWVRDAAIVRDATCDQCETVGTAADDSVDLTDQLVSAQLGWCGCGTTWKTDRMMLAYLRSLDVDGFPKITPGVSGDAVLLLANIAHTLSWTEHGGTVEGSWLTDVGRLVIERLTAAIGPAGNIDTDLMVYAVRWERGRVIDLRWEHPWGSGNTGQTSDHWFTLWLTTEGNTAVMPDGIALTSLDDIALTWLPTF